MLPYPKGSGQKPGSTPGLLCSLQLASPKFKVGIEPFNGTVECLGTGSRGGGQAGQRCGSIFGRVKEQLSPGLRMVSAAPELWPFPGTGWLPGIIPPSTLSSLEQHPGLW